MNKEERNSIVESMETQAQWQSETESIPVKEVAAIIVASWPLIKMALKLAKVFTGPKADAKIDQIIKDIDSLV